MLGLVTVTAPPRRLNDSVIVAPPEVLTPARATPLARLPMSLLPRLPSWMSVPVRLPSDTSPPVENCCL